MSRLVALDTGALIAMERRKSRGVHLLQLAREGRIRMKAPRPVVAEWWRGHTEVRARVLTAVDVEPISLEMAMAAGEAMAALPGATTIDAIVMAYAAATTDTVITSDLHDLERLRSFFPTVRVLSV